MNFTEFLALSVLLVAKVSAATSSTDLWDISQGSLVTGSSPMGYGAITNMFGDDQADASYPIEVGNAMFDDGNEAGYVHWVEWNSATVIQLNGYRLSIIDDFQSGNRGMSLFKLYGRTNNFDSWQLLDSFSPPIHPYSPYGDTFPTEFKAYEHTSLLSPFSGKFFRAEFTQYAPIYGVRVGELDAIATIPEISSSVLVVAFSSLGLLRRKRPQS
jgi:hypothetical protein